MNHLTEGDSFPRGWGGGVWTQPGSCLNCPNWERRSNTYTHQSLVKSCPQGWECLDYHVILLFKGEKPAPVARGQLSNREPVCWLLGMILFQERACTEMGEGLKGREARRERTSGNSCLNRGLSYLATGFKLWVKSRLEFTTTLYLCSVSLFSLKCFST